MQRVFYQAAFKDREENLTCFGDLVSFQCGLIFGVFTGQEQRSEEQEQATAIKDDEPQGGLAQDGVGHGGVEIEDGFTDKSDGLHNDGLDEGSTVPNGMKKGKEVRHIPHDEENTEGADKRSSRDAGNFKGGSITRRGDEER